MSEWSLKTANQGLGTLATCTIKKKSKSKSQYGSSKGNLIPIHTYNAI